jgi:hypothetical protein
VDRKWIGKKIVESDLLTAGEIGPVADANELYRAVKGMRALPMGMQGLKVLLLAGVLPFIPVLATQVPLLDILKRPTGMVL